MVAFKHGPLGPDGFHGQTVMFRSVEVDFGAEPASLISELSMTRREMAVARNEQALEHMRGEGMVAGGRVLLCDIALFKPFTPPKIYEDVLREYRLRGLEPASLYEHVVLNTGIWSDPVNGWLHQSNMTLLQCGRDGQVVMSRIRTNLGSPSYELCFQYVTNLGLRADDWFVGVPIGTLGKPSQQSN